MPVVIRNGKQYRMSFLTGSVREEKPPPYARSVSADRYQVIAGLVALNLAASQILTHLLRNLRDQAHDANQLLPPFVRHSKPFSAAAALTPAGTVSWSSDDDRILRELKRSRISWERISMVMDDRPIADLKRRWLDIQDDRQRRRAGYRLEDVEEDVYPQEEYDREKRHVSFRVIDFQQTDDDEYIPSRRTKVKKIYYMDDQFTLDEVLLLHQIAADWKKDRWDTISSRFNDKTGRNITPDQAKSVIDD
ncbi:SANT/Myb-like DNA-binding domain-containing protein [Aspergillus undulatus]|uniref:SANT/Myb-like DNA-binding domain-containing protein n=1 Tax=Aspergillus undulatus TaxID=1810928 RepID=UPI003CCE1638